MPQSLEAGLPQVKLSDGYRITFEARDPTTGAAVGGVTVANTMLFAEVEGDIELGTAGPVGYVPAGTNGTAV